ncbi:MAG: sigma-70 family RNA polymerase sigma factor [Lachnospiraceae bacterium]
MGEICELIDKIKRNKEDFYLIVERFSPLINKYTKLLYKDEKEDVYEELVTALWEAIQKMMFYENDGQIVNYLSTALKNKYMELYRISRRLHDHVVEMTDDKVELAVKTDNSYDEILIQIGMQEIFESLGENKKELFRLIFMKGLTDIEAANQLHISRQYVHRMRKKYYEEIKKHILS